MGAGLARNLLGGFLDAVPWRILMRYVFVTLSLAASLTACTPVQIVETSTTAYPYESCDGFTDVCTQGLSCLPTTLPVSAGFTGELCTSGCSTDFDCPQLLSNYAAICVNRQCYTQCPDGGANCPYGTGCVAFSDDFGGSVDICTP